MDKTPEQIAALCEDLGHALANAHVEVFGGNRDYHAKAYALAATAILQAQENTNG